MYQDLNSELVAALYWIKAKVKTLVSLHNEEAIVANACVEGEFEGASPNLA